MSDGWRLESLKIEYKQYGEHKGKHSGRISFMNGEGESFTFNIGPEVVGSYINLIAKDIVSTADTLGKKLLDSLGLVEEQKPVKMEEPVQLPPDVSPPKKEGESGLLSKLLRSKGS